MKRYAGLLRAVNVGGRKVEMARLRAVAEAAGFAEPRTLLASGNIVFGTGLSTAEAARALEAAIEAEFGLFSDVMVRDVGELKAVVGANPFPKAAAEEPNRLMAVFLNGEPQAGLETLESACVFGEEVRAGPGCLYIRFPQGAGQSKLSNVVMERRLRVRGTARNWNTVGKLIAALEA
ncbi:DUF1697 domain-containing protein [Phenylobacterium sp.]|uniref:DUF1697 domain-containing protein n=1 Tax=Phenylobacterium sp. TaxID=1871053 RepID=UPI0025CFA7A3|nr:DUF1697 domain-containing protein [Phenylobacterium sp.]MBX3482600.1 DUF1697 domain-containing protein [Phenylobacterium sp.]MCW5760468.1 DUF1697 domain-containing protein [Phenylobacterium sp.]